MTIDPALSAINLPGSGRNSDSLPRERRPSPVQLTEVSYTAYSPSPSDIALWKNKRSGIAGWNQDVPTHAKSPDTSLEPAMAARSATWASTIGTSRPQRTDPSRIRSPPIPLLALPPSPAPTSPPHHPPKLLPAAPGDFLGPLPSTRSTSHTEREAYLASALELPLDLIARVDSPVAPPPSPGSNVTTGRLGSLLGISRGKSQRVPSDTRSSHKSDVPRSEGGSIETGGTNRQEASRLTRCQTTSAVSGQGQDTRLGSGNGYRSLGPSAKARQVGLIARVEPLLILLPGIHLVKLGGLTKSSGSDARGKIRGYLYICAAERDQARDRQSRRIAYSPISWAGLTALYLRIAPFSPYDSLQSSCKYLFDSFYNANCSRTSLSTDALPTPNTLPAKQSNRWPGACLGKKTS